MNLQSLLKKQVSKYGWHSMNPERVQEHGGVCGGQAQEHCADQPVHLESREMYAPVAYRVAFIYFVVQDLQKVNHMYQFSLNWFRSVFIKSLDLTNTMKEDP